MLALEARARGYTCFVYGPKEMSLHGNRVTARVRQIEDLRRERGAHVRLGPPRVMDLSSAQVVLMRRLLTKPRELAPWYNATGISLYVGGMLISAFAVRPLLSGDM